MSAAVELVCLGLGTNLGDRQQNLRIACRELSVVFQFEMFSRVFETAPWGVTDQPKFLNLCAIGKTALDPYALLNYLKDIESALGRTPTFRYGPRLIDIDILMFGERVISSNILAVPHPNMSERAFVMIPLREIAGEFRHPITGESIGTLANRVENLGVIPIEPQMPFPPHDLLQALAEVPGAQTRFLSLAPSHARTYLSWLEHAKKPKTRAVRCEAIVCRMMNAQTQGGSHE